ncbi:uncharacterized protein FOMMEDRAFT_144521 [Fomitiporia mediterranea MF3/22]|uniref:uncharacterized protein n=1 Tax=Fomitiporia mediterranea (strain MF3/22) TaxID=694068 RepID=UPI0004408BBE|nr:uncharacterized protein FOMMEDRAFT_144521 [Fomitiporia mediterranea MF3/22]EJD06502.1 hypothetical protein FOMMEDRAFT_144521 [Fomitiporia mediterranea MF3/22]
MASTVLPPSSQLEAKDDTPARELGSAPAPVLREGAVSASSPPAVSQTSSSELGLPGTFPRDPHVPLDRLSEKATTTTEETDSNTLLGAAREDVRRAVDAAAQYLPEGVVGAIGSVLAVGTLDSAAAEKKFDVSQTSGKTRSTFSDFDPSKMGVAGIATDLNLPSKSREAPASTIAARRASEPSATAAKPAFVSYLPGPVITVTTPPPERSETSSTTQQQEDYAAFVAYAPGPIITDAPPSDDDDTNQKDTEAIAERRRPGVESTSTKDASKKKRAAEAAAVGAGVGTLGGAAYKRSSPADKAEGTVEQPTSQDTAKTSSDVAAFPKPAGAPAPAPVSKEPVRGGAEARRPAETGASTDSTKKREAVQAAALGAGIGTLGGATYEYSRSSARAPEQITSNETSGLGANIKAQPDARVPTSALKGLQDQTHPAPSADDKKIATQHEKHAPLAGAAVPATVPAEKEAKKEPSAFADDKQSAPPTDPYKEKDTPPVLAPVASADKKSDKEAKKEAKRLEEERKKVEKNAEKERHDKEKEVAAAAAAAEAAQKRAQKEAKEREKEMKKEAKTREKEEKKLQKEVEKEEKEREKEMKRQEKEAATVVAVGGGGVGAKEVEDAKRGEVQPEEKPEKKEGVDEGKKVKSTRTKDEAAAAAAATLAAASAEREHKRKSSVDSPPQPTAAQADSKAATNDRSVQRRPGAIDDKAVVAGEVPGNKQVKGPAKDESRGWQKDDTTTDESKTKSKQGAAATTAVVGGTAAAIALALYSAKQEKKQKPSDDASLPSKDVTSTYDGGSKPTRPGPTSLTNEDSPAKSGSDSDFPLPSEGAVTTPVRAVDISGKGPSATPALGTGIAKTTSAPAAVSDQTPPPPGFERTRYHGTEGLQEKYEGGALKSSFIGRRSDEVDRAGQLQGSEPDKSGNGDKVSAKENGKGNKETARDDKDSGSGKKEGIVKHIVEKVKDKLHHH